ncbi:MAG: hypothetical protein DWI24_03340 [Planctomycetota bacterium]|nr:MAG: hypothetical protein DWI24_03340 [Planctomycetota bacterium]
MRGPSKIIGISDLKNLDKVDDRIMRIMTCANSIHDLPKYDLPFRLDSWYCNDYDCVSDILSCLRTLQSIQTALFF